MKRGRFSIQILLCVTEFMTLLGCILETTLLDVGKLSSSFEIILPLKIILIKSFQQLIGLLYTTPFLFLVHQLRTDTYCNYTTRSGRIHREPA